MTTPRPDGSGSGRRWSVGTSGRVLAAVLTVLCVQGLLWLDGRAHPDGGADIGAGLVGLLVFALAPAVWGARDGWRLRRLAPLVVRWVAVGAVFAVAWAIVDAITADGRRRPGPSASLLDLVSDAAPLVLLVSLPALVTGTVAARWLGAAAAR